MAGCCGLLSDPDWLHSELYGWTHDAVADCFRTRIGYTSTSHLLSRLNVADCFRTRIGYTHCGDWKLPLRVADCFRTRIGYT